MLRKKVPYFTFFVWREWFLSGDNWRCYLILILMIGNNQFLYLKIPIARSLNSPDVYCFFEWDITPKFSWSLFWLIVLVLINCHGISNLTGSNFSDLFLLGVTDDSKPALAKITPKIKPWMTKKVFYSTANNFLIISLTLFCLSVFVSNHHIATISWIKTLTLL